LTEIVSTNNQPGGNSRDSQCIKQAVTAAAVTAGEVKVDVGWCQHEENL